jgi:fructokinase
MQVWSVGEILWDIFPDGERLGGAPLNFWANMKRQGDTAHLLSAIGCDIRGEAVLKSLEALDLRALVQIAIAAECWR